jgi:hypothetical protein
MSALCHKRTLCRFLLIALIAQQKCFTSKLRAGPYCTGLSGALVKHPCGDDGAELAAAEKSFLG